MPDIRLDSTFQQARGVIGRYPRPGERYVFPFDAVAQRLVHMVGVRRPLQVEWYADGSLVAREVLQPWTGWARYRADRIVEQQP